MSFTPTWSGAAEALFRLDAPTAFSAGAGSGKTTALVELCVRLLSGEATGTPVDPGAIVAITFTEKAASELALRLREAVLARAAKAEAAGGAAAEEWRARLQGLDRMVVGTIHAFCGRLLREQAVEARLDPEFTVLDEAGAWPLKASAARGAVVAALDAARPEARGLCAWLGAEELAGLVVRLMGDRSVRGLRGPQAVAEAAPGALDEARAVLLRAAAEVEAARDEATTDATRGVVERVAARLEGLERAYRDGPVDWAAVEGLQDVAEAIGRMPVGKKLIRLRPACEALRAAAEELPALAAEQLGQPQREELARLTVEAEERYAEACRGASGLDFDGLLTATRDLLADHPALRGELRSRYRALLVDEYQDVNGVQREIFTLLTAPDPAQPPGPVAVAVGDLKQSIYGFRGADVSVFAGLMGELRAGAGRVLDQAENHRSAPAVVRLVNQLSHHALQPPPGLAPAPFELSFTERDALEPRRPEGLAPAAELLDDGAPGDAAARRRREARALAARIGALVSGRAAVPVRERRREPDRGEGELARRPRHGDIAILFRRGTALLSYEQALREAGIPARLGRGAFHQAPEVRDLGELLTSLTAPRDALAWAALFRSPLCAVSDSTLLALAAHGLARVQAATPAELAALPMEPAERRRLERFLATWRELRPLRDRLPPERLLRRAVEALDLEVALAAGPDGERRRGNLEKALGMARAFGERGGSAAELASWLRAQAEAPPREAEAAPTGGEAVTLTTIHAAKGLEWPIVLLADAGAREPNTRAGALIDGDGRLCAEWFDPRRARAISTRSIDAARELSKRASEAESRRLLYVGLTRARDLLVISGEGAPKKDGSRGFTGWRKLLEDAVGGDAALVRRLPLAEAGTAAHGPALPPDEVSAPQPVPQAVAPPRLARPAPPPSIRLAVTQLAEFSRCPRRHHLTRVLGLVEPVGLHGGATDDDPARATARGTLAHAMLSDADLAAAPSTLRTALAAVAVRRGYDPEDPGVVRIRDEVLRFLGAPPGRALAEAAREGRLRRELPFLLKLAASGPGAPPPCYLSGAIDALVLPRAGERLLVLDYKYSLPRGEAAERYRLQLEAYALAVSRLHRGAVVEARLQFLRGDHSWLDVTPAPEALARFEADAPGLAAGVASGTGDAPPAAFGRDEPRCREEGCGFVARCFPREGATSGPGPTNPA